jgi:putative phosphoesterase
MKIAVLSDIHDNVWNLKKVLGQVKKENCQAIIFCGDFCAPFSAVMLAESKLPVYAVLGNSYDAFNTLRATDKFKNFNLFSERGEVELDKKKIAICHYPKLARGLAFTREYDAVFYGHNHQASNDSINKTLLANPGEVMGRFGKCTFGIYDTKGNKFQIIKI